MEGGTVTYNFSGGDRTARQVVTLMTSVVSPPPITLKTNEARIAVVVQVGCSETVPLVRMIDGESRLDLIAYN